MCRDSRRDSLMSAILYSLKKLLKTQALRSLFIYRKMTIPPLTMIFLKNGDVRNVTKVECGKKQGNMGRLWHVIVIQIVNIQEA